MNIRRCTADDCGRPFQVNTFGPPLSAPYELGKIVCPNCGAVATGDPASLYLSHALSAEQEERARKRWADGPDNTSAVRHQGQGTVE